MSKTKEHYMQLNLFNEDEFEKTRPRVKKEEKMQVRLVDCPKCNGAAWDSYSHKDCDNCAGRGFVPVATETTGEVRPLRVINTKVAGVSYKNSDGTARQWLLRDVRAGNTVTLVRDKSNKFDKNAIKVMINGPQIGWIKKELAGDLAAMMDDGYIITGKVTRKTGVNSNHYGCNIALFVYEPPQYPGNLEF